MTCWSCLSPGGLWVNSSSVSLTYCWAYEYKVCNDNENERWALANGITDFRISPAHCQNNLLAMAYLGLKEIVHPKMKKIENKRYCEEYW